MAYQTVNPYTNEVEHTYADTTPEEVEKALSLAHGLYL